MWKKWLLKAAKLKNNTKAISTIEQPAAKTIFRSTVYKGGEITDPHLSFFTTDPKYAAQYGPVKQYIVEGNAPSIAKEPLIGYRDPVSMDMFLYNNTSNPVSTIILGKDAITNDIPYQSKGIEIISFGKNPIKSITSPQTISLEQAINNPYKGTNYVFHATPMFSEQFLENESRAIVPSFGIQRLSQLKKYLQNGTMNTAELYPDYKFIGGKDVLKNTKIYDRDAGTVSVLDAGYTNGQYVPSKRRQAVADYLLKLENWKDAKQISIDDLSKINISDYAEAKYPGLFELERFPYALFPEGTSQLNKDAIKFFQNKGVKIKLYTPTIHGKVGDFNDMLQELLNEHPEILFKQGGTIKSIFNA